MFPQSSLTDDNILWLQVLINNAAVTPPQNVTRTKEGFEAQFGANHLGHFLFTSLLFPLILEAKCDAWKPRIVNLSSKAATLGAQSRFDDIQYIRHPEEYSPYAVYSQTKTASNLFSIELAKRYQHFGVLSYAVNPGVVLGTDLAGMLSEEDLIAWGEFIEASFHRLPSQKPSYSRRSPQARWYADCLLQDRSRRIIDVCIPYIKSGIAE